jgi:hypothetical protein
MLRVCGLAPPLTEKYRGSPIKIVLDMQIVSLGQIDTCHYIELRI